MISAPRNAVRAPINQHDYLRHAWPHPTHGASMPSSRWLDKQTIKGWFVCAFESAVGFNLAARGSLSRRGLTSPQSFKSTPSVTSVKCAYVAWIISAFAIRLPHARFRTELVRLKKSKNFTCRRHSNEVLSHPSVRMKLWKGLRSAKRSGGSRRPT